MPRKKSTAAVEAEAAPAIRPFWSGVISFGLVSLPVGLYPANRARLLRLSMVDEKGARLRRRYRCQKDNKLLKSKDIIRGYPDPEKGFIVVEDKELRELAPDKHREIDLQRFVPLEQIDPVFFERSYFLVPDRGGGKAYQLLAEAMAQQKRAGLASFVMRDREYLIAILAEDGLLRAETLRFVQELRSPEDLEVGTLPEADDKLTAKLKRAAKKLARDTLDRKLLADPQYRDVYRLAQQKVESGRDLLTSSADNEDDGEQEDLPANVVDMMAVLKQRLASAGEEPAPASDGEGDLDDLSKDELYRQAQYRGIRGRSKMSRDELLQALQA